MNALVSWLWPVLSSGAVAAVIAFVVTNAYRTIEGRALERLRTDLDRESRRLDAQQRTLDERASTQYSWVYEQRAKAMLDIYVKLVDAENALIQLTRAHKLSGINPRDAWLAFKEAGEAFRAALIPQRLFFGEATAKRLDDLNRFFVKTFYEFYTELSHAQDDEYKAQFAFMKNEKFDLAALITAHEELEVEFRRLYGSGDE
jgi:hypothetical protein